MKFTMQMLTGLAIGLIITLIFIASFGCSNKNYKKMIHGFAITQDIIDSVKTISVNMCESGIISIEDCSKIEMIYAAIDILYPELQELCKDMFQSQEQNNHQDYIAKYIIKLSEYNQLYFELMQIIQKYKNI